MRTLRLAPLVLAQLLFGTVALAQSATNDSTVQVEAEVVIPPPPAGPSTEEAAPAVVASPPPSTLPPPSPLVNAQSAQPYSLAAPEMRVEHRMNRGLAIGGGVLFGVSWAVNILGSGLGTLVVFSGGGPVGALTADQTFGASFIPVAGPLIFSAIALERDGGYGLFAAIGIIDAAAQIAGLTMLIIGIVGEDVEVNVNADTALIVLPYSSSEGAGVSVSGTF